MPSINDYLLDELLIEIFGYLTPVVRRNCRKICLRWNDLLINEFRFRQDYHLNLWHRLSRREILFLKSTECHFGSIHISNRAYKYPPNEEIKDFWDHLGKTVTKMAICCQTGFYDVLGSFSLLKSLELKQCELFEPKVLVMANLEHLTIGNFSWIKNIDLLQAFSKLKSIDCKNYYKKDEAILFKSFKMNPTLWKIVNWCEGDPGFDKFGDTFLHMENTKIERIRYFTNGSFNFLFRVLELHPQLKEVMVNINTGHSEDMVMPPTQLQHRISALKINISRQQKLNFIPLVSFTSLKDLIIKSSDVQCPIGHVIISNPILERLYFTNVNALHCFQCFKTLTRTFPNLKGFTLVLRYMSVTVKQEFLKHFLNWKNLQYLEISIGELWGEEDVDCFPHELKHSSLKQLILKGVDVCQFSGILKLLPKFEKLVYDFCAYRKFGRLPEYLQYLPELKCLEINLGELYDFDKSHGITENDVHEIITAISEHTKKLQNLSVPVFFGKRADLFTKGQLLFKSLPKLQTVEFQDLLEMDRLKFFDRAAFE